MNTRYSSSSKQTSPSSSSSSVFPQDVAVGNHIRRSSSSNNKNINNNKNPLQKEGEFGFSSDNNNNNNNNKSTASSSSSSMTLETLSPSSSSFSTSSPSQLHNQTLPSAMDGSQQQQQQPLDPATMALTIALPFLLVLAFCVCSRGNAPGQQYWRGAHIRDAARRVRQRRILKKQRHDLTPEERQAQIWSNMRTMTVVAKDTRTGYLKLSGSSSTSTNTNASPPETAPPPAVATITEAANQEEEDAKKKKKKKYHQERLNIKTTLTEDTDPVADDDNSSSSGDDEDDEDDEDVTTKRNNIFRNVSSGNEESNVDNPDEKEVAEVGFGKPRNDMMTILQSKGSEDTADTLDSESPTPSVVKQDDDCDENEEEDVCHICLDSFEVGDVVMWSRNRTANGCGSNNNNKFGHEQDDCNQHDHIECRHVFHQECLMPWLMEKRENECPSCRAAFIVDNTFICPPTEDQEDENNDNPNSDAAGSDRASNITENNNITQERVEVDRDGTIHITMGDGTRTTLAPDDDIEEALIRMMEAGRKNSHQREDVVVVEDAPNDIEEGHSFVIAKGLIKTIPNHYGSLACVVPFQRLPREAAEAPER